MSQGPIRPVPFPPVKHQGTLPETLKVRPGKGLRGTILSPNVLGVWTHWVGSRSVPCNSKDPAICLVDHRTAGRRRWQGWVCVLPDDYPVPGFLGLTEGTVDGCRGLRAEVLRGAVLHCWRKGENKESKMLCRLDTTIAATARKLPKAPSTEEFLCRLWNVAWTGKLPDGVGGWPEEQKLLGADQGGAEQAQEDPLLGTIWEGMELPATEEEAASLAAEAWKKMRGRLQQ